MSEKRCCVPGCPGTGRTLHKFPHPEKDEEQFKSWLYAIGGDILGLNDQKIYKNRRVCELHFEDKYLCRNNRIANNAVPTKLILGPLSWNTMESAERRPLEPIPSTSSDPNPIQFLPCASSNKEIEKENIDPNMPLHEDLPVLNTTEDNHEVSGPDNEEQIQEETKSLATRKCFFSKKERQLHSKICAARVKVAKLKNKVRKQRAAIKLAKKFTSNSDMLDVLENSTSTAKLLMKMQWRENKKTVKGRRFSLEEKIACLSIFKQSPKAYRFLRKIFILPAPQTLIKLLQQSNIQPGINKNIFNQLKKSAAKMGTHEKLSILLFDEISLKPNIIYNERKSKIIGVVDNGKERKPEFADHAQVFMLRGLINNYKQAISYTFSASATKGPELARQIKEVISGVQEAGLIVVASVCDQGTNNRQAIKLLLNETRGIYLRRNENPKDNIILINEQEIIPLYDPPHLLKGIRNNLITKNLKYTIDGVEKTAQWSHLQLLYKENPGYKGVRLIPKLTENHVNPEKMNKMKVKLASQVFSCTIASNMGYLSDKGILPTECSETADFFMFMDKIFDSVNGSFVKNRFAKPLLGPVTPKSLHNKTWMEGIRVFKSMYFINNIGKKESVPTIENWVWTLNGIQILLYKLRINFGITSVWMRHLNQDPLENFFGAIRSHGCRNINPNCEQFESAFATLIINNINSVHTPNYNCEGDFCQALQTIIVNENAEPSSASFDLADVLEFNFTPIAEKEKDPRKIATLQYMSGYFLKKTKAQVFRTCKHCKADLESKDTLEYIQRREFEGRRWLCTPSKQLIQLVSNLQDLLNHLIKEKIEYKNLNHNFKTVILSLIDFTFLNCIIHREKLVNYLIKIVMRCLIFNYCKIINQILAGRRQVDDDDDVLQIKAKKLNRCFKRHK